LVSLFQLREGGGGNPRNLTGYRGRAIQVRAADEFAQTVLPVIRAIQAAGTTSFASIADGSPAENMEVIAAAR
jgi:hypothetical protein